MMRITKLKKYGSPIRSDVRGCPQDGPCAPGASDGTCTVNDAPCYGPGTSDGDCGWGGDTPCMGLGVSDFCNANTGIDTKGCIGLFKVDTKFAEA